MSEESGLKVFCIGIVAVTKPTGTDIIEVYPVEHLSIEDGDVTKKQTASISIKDTNGISFKSTADRSALIEARWIPDGSDGRQTPPDVVAGETVKIFRFADSEVFHWNTIFREPGLRRLEHVVFGYSNLRSGRVPFDANSSYGILFSTIDKKIAIWTSQSDGEKYKYSFVMDSKNNSLNLGDNVDNYLNINSNDSVVTLNNASGTSLTLDKKDSNIKAETHTVTAEKILLDSPEVTATGTLKVSVILVGGEKIDVEKRFEYLQKEIDDIKKYIDYPE